jgi:hypothetical protein
MGVGGSAVAAERAKLLPLLTTDYRRDHDFWLSFFVDCPTVRTFAPHFKLLVRIGTTYPHNLLILTLRCIHHVHLCETYDHPEDLDAANLAFALGLFAAICQITMANPHLFALLVRIDANLSGSLATANLTSLPSQNGQVNHAKKKSRRSHSEDGPLFHCIYDHEGKGLTRFATSITRLLFRPGLTVFVGQRRWGDHQFELAEFCRTRQALVRSLLAATSLDFFTGKSLARPTFLIPLTDFPWGQFVESICLLCSVYSHIIAVDQIDHVLNDLLQSAFVLMARSSHDPRLRDAIRCIKPQWLLQVFSGTLSLFSKACPLASEALSFLWLALKFKSQFVQFLVREGRSNALMLELLDIARRSADEVGPAVGTVLSILRLITSDSSAAMALNDPYNDGRSGLRPVHHITI